MTNIEDHTTKYSITKLWPWYEWHTSACWCLLFNSL